MLIKRSLDLFLSFFGLLILSPFFLFTYLIVKLTSSGPALYWSKRIGQNNKIFMMPKFRSMKIGTPQIATHLLQQKNDSQMFLTPVGNFIRKTSLDEIPQLWSVLKGDMSIVGPRPALFNQKDLIILRTKQGIDRLKPGITGWAQINGRDEISISQKVALDYFYLSHQSILLDIKITLITAIKVLRRDNITH